MKLYTIEQRKKLLEEELKRILNVLKEEYKPEKVILFGSLADGNIHEWSDIDLLIIKKTEKRPIERILEICQLAKLKVGIDLFVYTPEEFNMLIKEGASFITTVVKEGEVLYEKRD